MFLGHLSASWEEKKAARTRQDQTGPAFAPRKTFHSGATVCTGEAMQPSSAQYQTELRTAVMENNCVHTGPCVHCQNECWLFFPGEGGSQDQATCAFAHMQGASATNGAHQQPQHAATEARLDTLPLRSCRRRETGSSHRASY